MRFRVTNIRPGYCEVWANERDGGRYQQLALVVRDEGMWSWHAKEHEPPFDMPFYTREFKHRLACIIGCERTALLRQAQRAIDEGKGFSGIHWHCPCRMALHDMQRSGLFSIVEMHEMRERMEASGPREVDA